MRVVSVKTMHELYESSCIGDDLLLIDDFRKIPVPEQPRKIECVVLGLCLEGSVKYTIDTEPYDIHTNDVLVMTTGRVLADYEPSPDLRGILILMSDGYFQEVMKDIHDMSSLFLFSRIHPVLSLHPDELSSVQNYFRAIKMKVDDQTKPYYQEVSRSLMTAMSYDVCNVIAREREIDIQPSRAESFFIRFIELVKRNFRTERRVSWYGEQLGITPKYLSEVVRQASKRTPNDWIDYYLMLELRVMLRNSSMSIKQIADELNFSSQSFLGKFFKAHAGISPARYRKGARL